jgi:hypothetical protein
VDFSSLDALRTAGFLGFSTIRELQTSRCCDVPQEPGIYLIVRDPAQVYGFSQRSCGGRFKGKDPRVPVSLLAGLIRSL